MSSQPKPLRRPRSLFRARYGPAAAVLLLWVVSACKGSVSGKINSGGDAEGKAEGTVGAKAFAELDDPNFNNAGNDGAAETAALKASGELALLGARHDLYLKQSGAVQCQCLTASVGHPSHPDFKWEGTVPKTDPRQQIVVAFSSEGQACPAAPDGSQGAAYRGYEQEGKDTIILLETAGPGKPLVTGAIVPPPKSGGRLLLRPYLASLPYGRGLADDDGQCQLQGPTGPDVAALAKPVSKAPTSAKEGSQPDPRGFTLVDVSRQERVQPSFEDIDVPSEFEEDTSHSERNAFFLRLMLGGYYARMTLETDDRDGTISGPGAGFSALLGGAISPGNAVGVVLSGISAPSPTLDAANTRTLDNVSANYVRLGLFGDTYPIADSNFHLGAELVYLSTFFTASEPVADDSHGIGLSGGAGYDFWLSKHMSLGFMFHLSYGIMSGNEIYVLADPDGDGSEKSAFSALLPGLAATFTYH